MTMRYSSHAVARLADLTLVPVDERGLVHQKGPWLEIGPDACDDLIVTTACRRIIRKGSDEESADESAVRRLVEEYGYAYVPQFAANMLPNGPGLVSTSSARNLDDMSKRYVEKDPQRAVVR